MERYALRIFGGAFRLRVVLPIVAIQIPSDSESIAHCAMPGAAWYVATCPERAGNWGNRGRLRGRGGSSHC